MGRLLPRRNPMPVFVTDHHLDAILAARAKRGDKDAADRLVSRYWRLADVVAQEFVLPGIRPEEKHSEALRGLVRAMASFEDGRGCVFKSWAKKQMSHALNEMHRRFNRKGEVPLLERLSTDCPLDSGEEEDTLGDTLAAPDDTEREAIRRLDQEGEEQRFVSRLVNREARLGHMREQIAAQIEAHNPHLAFRVRELIGDGEESLIHLGPEPGSIEAEECAREAIPILLGSDWGAMVVEVGE